MRRERQGVGRHIQAYPPPYDDTQIAGLTLMTGHDMMTARFRETPEVDPDGSATPRDAVGVEQDILPVIHEKNPFR